MPSNNGIGSLGNGLVALWNRDAQQWQPKDALLWSHNPNPPITLETRGNAGDAAGTSTANAVATSAAASKADAFNRSFGGVSVAANTTVSSTTLWTGTGTFSAFTFFCHFLTFAGETETLRLLDLGTGLTISINLATEFIDINFQNTNGVNTLRINYTPSTSIRNGQWHSLGVSINGAFAAGARQYSVCLDGTPVTVNVNTDSGSTILSPEPTFHRIQAPTGFPGRISEHFFDRQYIDFSNPTNVAKFIDSSNVPANKGENGSGPFGTAPFAYFAVLPGEAASDFLTNHAGGPGLNSGSVSILTTSPSSKLINATGSSTFSGVAAATGGSSNSVRRFTSAIFNGASTSSALVGNPASLSDSDSMTMTCAFKTSDTSSTTRYLYCNFNQFVLAYLSDTGHLSFLFATSGYAESLTIEYDAGYDLRDGRFHSFGISVSTNFSAGNKIVHLVVDGKYITNFGPAGYVLDTSPAFTFNLATGSHYIGYDGFSNRFSGELAEFTMDASTSVDFSNSSELVKFFYDDGTPRSMGDDASAAYGFPPALYFRLLSGEPGSAFFFNRTGRTNSWGGTAPAVGSGPLPLGLTYAITNYFATGVGSATSTGTGTATGSVGGSINSGDASASATSTASATGTAVRPSTGAAAGTSTPSATSAVTIASLASAAGTSTVAATSQTIKLVTVAASGTSAVAATGASTSASTAAAAGTSIPAATGNALKPATASSAGTSTVTGISQPGSNGAATATSTATATGAAIAAATASASATSTPSATGNSIRAASAAAAGVTTPTATGTGIRTLTATASATSTPTATGAAIVASIISATGTSSVTATGVAIKPVTASAIATSTVAANANTVIASTASATATSTAAATYSSGTKRMLLLGVG